MSRRGADPRAEGPRAGGADPVSDDERAEHLPLKFITQGPAPLIRQYRVPPTANGGIELFITLATCIVDRSRVNNKAGGSRGRHAAALPRRAPRAGIGTIARAVTTGAAIVVPPRCSANAG